MRRLQGLGFALFCLLSGSRWLLDNAFPSDLPILFSQALHYGLIGLVTLVIWSLRRQKTVAVCGNKSWLKIALAGVLLLGLPTLLQEFARSVAEQDGAALSALGPLFVVVSVAAYGRASAGQGMMMPALVGLAGAMLVLPFQLPSTGYGALLFAVLLVAAMLTAVASVWLHELLLGCGIVLAIVLICVGNVAVLGVAATMGGIVSISAAGLRVEVLRCIAFDLPQMFLLVWLLREIVPVRFSVRYLIAPLLTAVEGMIFLHPGLDLRMVAGLLLMAGGAAALLFWRVEDESSGSLKLGVS